VASTLSPLPTFPLWEEVPASDYRTMVPHALFASPLMGEVGRGWANLLEFLG